MSSRNRNRANPNQDADEERRLWKEIKDKARDVDGMVARSNEIGTEILAVETQQAALIDAAKPGTGSASLDERLEKLYRENLKLTEEVQHIIEGKSNDMNLLDSIKILAGLREASEESLLASQLAGRERSTAAATGRGKGRKAGGARGASIGTVSTASAVLASNAVEDAEDVTSAAPSPRISIASAATRLAHAHPSKSSRGNSIPTTRETSVKIEHADTDSIASTSTTDAPSTIRTKGSSVSGSAGRAAHRIVLEEEDIVFCRHAPRNAGSAHSTSPASTNKPGGAGGLAAPGEAPEGEGILCKVTKVIGDGKQRRYEVQDADADRDGDISGTGGAYIAPPQRASVAQLMKISLTNAGLVALEKGRKVVSMYPDTTTFYRAEVSEAWSAKGGVEAMVKLRFEEDDAVKEVERRHVLFTDR